jgi:2-methylcitrate dehydratase PrpD
VSATPLADQLRPLLAALWSTAPAPHVMERARLLLLDTLGCAIAGAGEVAPLAGATMAGRVGTLALPGFAAPLDLPAAASLLATAACWDEACEGLARAHGRPGLHTAPVALALGLAGGATLGHALDALVAGYEVAGRLGEVLRIRPGMHVDGTFGVHGAAVTAARLRGLGPDGALDAIRTAACTASASLYLPIRRGSVTRNLYVGQAAERGIAAAAAVAAGIRPPADALEDSARVALGLDPATLRLAEPGLSLILEGYLKPYAAVRHAHYPAAAAIAWRATPGADAARLSAVTVETYSEAIAYAGNRAPAAPITAQFSLSWATAHALRHGELGPRATRSAALADPATRALEQRITLRPDPVRDAAGRRGATLVLRHADGQEQRIAIDSVPGDPGRPMTEAETVAKFLAYAGPVIGAAEASRLAEALLHAAATTPLRAILPQPLRDGGPS